MNQSTPVSGDTKQKVLTIIGTVLCIILLPILIINLTLIAKSYLSKDEVPSLGGVFPMIVLTDSMLPEISSGDLIICNTLEPEEVQVGDVISFFDPMGSGSAVVTHRVLEIVEKDGELSWRTKGDNNNAEDQVLVPEKNLVGIYRSRILSHYRPVFSSRAARSCAGQREPGRPRGRSGRR